MDYQRWFQNAQAIENEVERSLALCDLCFDAENMLATGNVADAIGLFKLLYDIGPDDDISFPAYKTARKALIQAGVLSLMPLSEIIKHLEEEFSHLPAKSKLVAVAKTLHREHVEDHPEAIFEVKNLMAAASQMAPLDKSEQRFLQRVLREST